LQSLLASWETAQVGTSTTGGNLASHSLMQVSKRASTARKPQVLAVFEVNEHLA